MGYKIENFINFEINTLSDNQIELIKIVNLTEIEIAVVKVMHSREIYGKNHKKIETITHSGFPSHLRKEVKKAILSLIKKEYILWYHKSDKSIQLNKKLRSKIEELLDKHIKEKYNET